MRCVRCVSTPGSRDRRLAGLKWLACLALLVAGVQAYAAPTVSLQTAGLTVSGGPNAYTMSLSGNVNGIGVNNTSGATGVSATDGFWYTTTLTIKVSGIGGASPSGTVAAWASSNTQFAACAGSGCTSSKLGTASPGTTVTGTIPNNQTTTITIGVFVSNKSGTGFSTTGASSITLTFLLTPSSGATDTATLAISFTNQNAVNLKLASSGGITIASTTDFGSVNGLGAGGNLTTGLTVLKPCSTAGCALNPGVIYSTPYQITPTFSSFTSSTGTVKVSVTSNFTHSSNLKLMDAGSASFASFSAIGVSPSSTTITNAASSATAITRYLGLEVLHINNGFPGPGSGSDQATLTYTITAP